KLIALGVALSAFACVGVDDDDPATSEDTSALSTQLWSNPADVGNPDQRAFYGAAVATLGNVTYMVHSGATSQYDLWWTKLTSSGWTTNIQIPNQKSNARVTLAAYNNELYMFHGGSDDSSTDVWMSKLDPATQTWSTNIKLSYSTAPRCVPAIVAYNGLLYIVGVTPHSNQLWMATMNASETFTVATSLGGQYSSSPVSLAVFQNRIYMAHRAGTTTSVVYNSFDGAWGADYTIYGGNGQPIQAYEPSIAAYNGYLHLVHVAPYSIPNYNLASYVMWTTFDGTSWDPEVSINRMASSIDPRLTLGSSGLVMVTTFDEGVPSGSGYVRDLKSESYWVPPIIIRR
ncbi:MAG TPA: hypothetical protein VGM90_19540, partial [Kofleriaceae bacterium]